MDCAICEIPMGIKERPNFLVVTCPNGCMASKVMKDPEFQGNCVHKSYCVLDCFLCTEYKSDLDVKAWGGE